MIPPGADTVLIRYAGEIGIKSKRVRRRMERQLTENAQALLTSEGIEGTVEDHRARPRINTTESSVDLAAETVAKVFGVSSTSPVLQVQPDLDDIITGLVETAMHCFDGGTFAVSARRAGDHEYTSPDVEEQGGSAIFEALSKDFSPQVDLDNPDTTFFVECRESEAFIYTEKRPGPNGLPLGTQNTLVALISGGIDSPVAAYEVMRRGSPIIPIYIDFGDYGGKDHEARAIETIRTLASYAPNFDMKTYLIPAGGDLRAIGNRIDRGRMLVLRRYMYRVAEIIANQENASGIVTGEVLGQKSSQTAHNLAVTSQATTLPIHRPLLSVEKNEIIERAKRIGTFTDSTIPAGCNRFTPTQVETKGQLEWIHQIEPDDLFHRAEQAVRLATIIDGNSLKSRLVPESHPNEAT